MRFSLIAVLAAAGMTAASPVHKRQTGGILLCTGANATGTCLYDVYPMNECVNITDPALKGATNTFAPDGEPFACYPYGTPCDVGICTSPEGCTLGAIDFDYPHKYNLSAVQWASVASFECFEKTTTSTTEKE